jgi:hypothetical protein
MLRESHPFQAPAWKDWTWLLESESKERWQVLCEKAAAEQDPAKFLAIIQELQAELDLRIKRMNFQQVSGGNGSAQKLPDTPD